MLNHLYSRYLFPNMYENTVSWDDETVCFQLFTLTGKLVGFQKYRPGADKIANNDPQLSRYYTYFTKPEFGFFGVNTLSYKKNVVILCEGVFDVCRFHNLGFPGLAIFSNNPKHLTNTIYLLKQSGRKVICVCDGDSAGAKLGKFGDLAIMCPEGKDPGSLNCLELLEIGYKIIDSIT